MSEKDVLHMVSVFIVSTIVVYSFVIKHVLNHVNKPSTIQSK